MLNSLFLLLSTATPALANRIFSPQIKSLTCLRADDWLAPAVLNLHSRQQFEIGFDELSHEYHRYVCHVVRCEPDWQPSEGLFESDWLDGFNDFTIDEYQNSINTTVLYTHYGFTFPNSRCKLRMSGNYIINIIDDGTDEKVAEVRFRVVEPLMLFGIAPSGNTEIDFRKSHQQLDLILNFQNLRVTNPQEQIMTTIQQNQREDNERNNVEHNITKLQGLEWRHNRNLIFDGGNNYHRFEILDVSHTTMGLAKMEWDGEMFRAWPFAVEPRRNYVHDESTHGQFIIRNSEYSEIDYTCEYVYTEFTLYTPYDPDNEIYVDGLWATDYDRSNYRMHYDAELKAYRATILLKQGYYSYHFLKLGQDGVYRTVESDGNFYETKNTYQAYAYYRVPGDRTWRLVAAQSVTGPN